MRRGWLPAALERSTRPRRPSAWREWAWSRLVSCGWERTGSDHLFRAMVENRQKASGFVVARARVEEAQALVELARAVAVGDRHGYVRALQTELSAPA